MNCKYIFIQARCDNNHIEIHMTLLFREPPKSHHRQQQPQEQTTLCCVMSEQKRSVRSSRNSLAGSSSGGSNSRRLCCLCCCFYRPLSSAAVVIRCRCCCCCENIEHVLQATSHKLLTLRIPLMSNFSMFLIPLIVVHICEPVSWFVSMVTPVLLVTTTSCGSPHAGLSIRVQLKAPDSVRVSELSISPHHMPNQSSP